MAKMKYAEVRSIISNLLDDEDFAKVEEVFAPTPTPTPTPAVSLTIEAVSVAAGATVAVSATYTEGASVSYTIADTGVATVAGNEVTGVTAGTTSITGVATKDGYTSASATATVTVA